MGLRGSSSGGDAVRAITRAEIEGDGIGRLRCHFFTPEFLAEACGELDVPICPCRLSSHKSSQNPEATAHSG
jgi:hypothetical protein